MPWARLPPHKLINLPLFGIDVIADDGDYVWLRGSRGRMRVRKQMPRVWFDSVEDAQQAGASAIRISTAAEEEELEALIQAGEAAAESEKPED